MKIVKALYSNQDLSGTFYFDSWTGQNLWTFLWEKYFPFSIWKEKVKRLKRLKRFVKKIELWAATEKIGFKILRFVFFYSTPKNNDKSSENCSWGHGLPINTDNYVHLRQGWTTYSTRARSGSCGLFFKARWVDL